MKRIATKLVSVSNIEQEAAWSGTLGLRSARACSLRGGRSITRFQMARVIGTDMATWGTYEAGVVRIPADQALKLSAYGISLDWVYQGRMTDLHPNIRAKIRQLATE
jgi:hypothetical protein